MERKGRTTGGEGEDGAGFVWDSALTWTGGRASASVLGRFGFSCLADRCLLPKFASEIA